MYSKIDDIKKTRRIFSHLVSVIIVNGLGYALFKLF
ncbi:hypothetical protein JOD82_004122 [Paenibacillus sp. 1182]|nr:hypothetical protein [Paenibacillus sp. 1182]